MSTWKHCHLYNTLKQTITLSWSLNAAVVEYIAFNHLINGACTTKAAGYNVNGLPCYYINIILWHCLVEINRTDKVTGQTLGKYKIIRRLLQLFAAHTLLADSQCLVCLWEADDLKGMLYIVLRSCISSAAYSTYYTGSKTWVNPQYHRLGMIISHNSSTLSQCVGNVNISFCQFHQIQAAGGKKLFWGMGLSNMNPRSADSVRGWQERWCKYDVESKTEKTQFQQISFKAKCDDKT